MKNYILFIALSTCVYKSQSQNLGDLVLASDDASLLAQNYLNPIVQSVMSDMNAGWYNTAKIHEKFGFDLSFSLNVGIVPDAGKMFTFNPSDYSYLTTQNGETQLETVFGENGVATTINVRVPYGSSNYKLGQFDLPGGYGEDLPLTGAPLPMVQAGVGLPILNSDFKLRYLPKQTFDNDKSISLIGFGLQHEITQYLLPLDMSLPLHVSVFSGYTSVNSQYVFSSTAGSNVQVTNGEAAFRLNAFTAQVIGSLDFKVLSFYGAIGYNSAKTSVNLNGDYSLNYIITNSDDIIIDTIQEQITDPIALEFVQSGLRGTLGTKLNIGFFNIFADYTIQEHNTLTAGFAFSFK